MTREQEDKIQNFLNQNVRNENISPAKRALIEKDLYSMDFEEFQKKYDKEFKQMTRGWSKIRTNKSKDLQTRIRDVFAEDNFNPSDRWKDEMYEEYFSDIDRETFENNLSQMRKYYEEYKKEGEENKLRRDRIKEMENVPWYKNILMNEYSKQRYIEDPNASIWGEHGEFNPYSKEGQAELADNILHFTSIVPDTYYGRGPAKIAYSTLAGPVTRSLRNLIVDSDIKEESPVGKLGKEVALNVGTQFAPTAWVSAVTKRGKNIAKSADAFDDVALKIAVEDETKAINSGIKSLKFDKKTPSQIMQDINKMPESSLKTDLQSILSNGNWNVEDLTKKINEYKVLTGKSSKEIQTAFDNAKTSNEKFDYDLKSPYVSRKLLDPELSKGANAVYYGTKVGVPSIELVARNVAQGQYESKPKTDYDKETIIKILSPKWKAGFKPKKGDKYYEIFEEWDAEQKGE